MGYYTNLTGRIEISPPVPWSKLLGTALTEFGDGVLRVSVVDTGEGTLTITAEGLAVEPYTDDSVRAHHPTEDLARIVDALPGHEFTGYIYGAGDETGDYWRLSVVDGRAVMEEAHLVWPDGTWVKGV